MDINLGTNEYLISYVDGAGGTWQDAHTLHSYCLAVARGDADPGRRAVGEAAIFISPDGTWEPAPSNELTAQQMSDIASYLPSDRREAIHAEGPATPREFVALYAARGPEWVAELRECAELAGLRHTVDELLDPPALDSLDAMLDAMLDGDPRTLDAHGEWRSDLPEFGGDGLDDTCSVWSWDESRIISGTCADDLEITERETECLDCDATLTGRDANFPQTAEEWVRARDAHGSECAEICAHFAAAE